MARNPVAQVEAEIREAFARLAESAAALRYCHERYLDGLADAARELVRLADERIAASRAEVQVSYDERVAEAGTEFSKAASDAAGTVRALVSAHPWKLSGFDAAEWDGYTPDRQARHPDGLRVGRLRTAESGEMPPLPAVARLAGYGHLLIAAKPEAADAARSLLQALALRLAISARPGTLKLALADPSGQGRHLSGFLRLPAALRAGDLAAAEGELEILLQELTEHVSEVNKTRLTNVYDSVEAYNARAPGMAIPYRVLVVDSFPAGFSDRAGELLARLARNGPRAGVYLIATLDKDVPLPRDFDLADLKSRATNLRLIRSGHMTWDDPDFRRVEVEPDQMPAASRANVWLDAVATAATQASRELPFAMIAISPEQRWQGDASAGLDVAIGVDGKGEPVHFVMGRDMAHHGLVGGNTQMGKSNLLHVLIHQLALRYPPEQLELYLLDFKEVEFNGYLTERLPHAKVIASRTDREFGLSVLRRFREEIGRRSKLWRNVKGANITNLAEYRQATGRALPRVLVIMDEFQVLLGAGGLAGTSDRIADEAGQVLAEVAQRGAAFGLHLLLSTQSPGHAPSGHLVLAYEQMTLRIAMACLGTKGADVSAMIVGDDSATKLTKPGDAIYQHPGNPGVNLMIRVALLSGQERWNWTSTIRAQGPDGGYRPPISFDPDAPAEFSSNPSSAEFAAHPGQWPDPGLVIEAWLGDAIEIKPATSAVFERAPKSNLLIVGGEEPAHRMLLAVALSAAVQLAPGRVKLTIADLAPPRSRSRGFFDDLAGLPQDVTIVGPRGADAALKELIADLDERLSGTGRPDAPDRFFLIAGLCRWPDLIPEDEYDQTASKELLTRLAQEGPETGIHIVAWADSYAAAEHLFRSRGIRRWFGLRIAFHLDPVESDDLLGSSAAASLTGDRALFQDTTDGPDGETEKFKPYSADSLRDFARTAFSGPT